mgnify:CR=1 FL=1
MRLFQSLSVGIVLAIALCTPAKADATLPAVPLISSTVWNATEHKQYVLPRVYHPTDVKSNNLKLVYEIAEPFGCPEIMQGILLQESNGGAIKSLVGSPNAPPGKRSYGLMQVQVVAARWVFKQHPDLLQEYFPQRDMNDVRDREIINLLLSNHPANVTIAVHHYALYLQMLDGDHTRTIAAYNVGIGGVQKLKRPHQFKYVVEVKRKIKEVVKPFNAMYSF